MESLMEGEEKVLRKSSEIEKEDADWDMDEVKRSGFSVGGNNLKIKSASYIIIYRTSFGLST
jgi:hypothetical protein